MLGAPHGVSLDWRRARLFFGLFTAMLVFGAAVALIPGLPVIQGLLLVQVLNGVLLPVLLVFMLRLANEARLMGSLRNTRWQNGVGWATFVVIAVAVGVMVGSQVWRVASGG
jgi:Mn2+/Fe2+ NRAMP family transporter